MVKQMGEVDNTTMAENTAAAENTATIDGSAGLPICVVHGDAAEEAEYVARLIKEAVKDAKVIINVISPSIGAHSGPGAIGICFWGENRNS
jgi:fatty acid-binding protein DegV